jgi:hypothetical protein
MADQLLNCTERLKKLLTERYQAVWQETRDIRDKIRLS